MGEAQLQQHQFEQGAPSDRLRPAPRDTPDASIEVSPSTFIRADGVTIEEFVALTVVGTFPVQGAGLERWDLVTLDPEAGPAFVITSGTPQALGGSFQTSVPAIPTNHIPVAAVKVDEPGTVQVVESDIVDVRGYYHEVDKSSVGITYTPGELTDWNGDADPGDVDAALDQVADRLNKGTAGAALAAITGAAGSSKDASRNDHVHPHGDLRAGGGDHHDTLQSEHTQITPVNWQTATPGSVSAHLEELAGLFPVWCRKSSDFASFQAAIDDLYASKAEAGVLTVDSVLTLSGSTVVDGSKPLVIIGARAGTKQINMDSGTLTFDSAGGTEIAPITFIDVFLLRQGTDTGAIVLQDRGVLTFEDCRIEDTSSTATLPLFDLTVAAGEMVLVLRRTKITAPSTNSSYFDISGPGTYKIYGYRFSADTSGTEKLFKRSGGGPLDIYLADHSIVLISDWGAVPGGINLHYDGTSLLTGDTTNDVNSDLTEIDGEAMFTIDFLGIVGLDLVLQFAAATHLILGSGNFIMPSVALTGGADRFLHVRGLDRTGSVIFGSGIASGTFISIGGSTGTYTFENLTIRVTGSGGGTAIILSSGSARIRHVSIEINTAECNSGVLGSDLLDVLVGGVGATFKAVAIAVTGSRGSAIDCQASAFESRGFDAQGQDSTYVNCTARMDDGVAGMVAFNVLQGAKLTNCVAFFAGAGAAIATSTGFKLTGATSDESHGCQLSNCSVDGENGASRLAVALELIDDGNIVTGCRFAHTTSHGANLQSTVNFSTLNGNQFRDIAGDGIRIDGSDDNVIANNVLAGVTGTEIIEVAASGADFNLIHGNHLRGGTITTIGGGTLTPDNLT